MSRQMHINVNVLSSGSHAAAWRAPDGNRRGYVDIAHYQEIARIAERGRLDAVFLADALAIAPDPAAGPTWALDPVVTVASMAAVTHSVGFIATSSTTYSHPYNVARAFCSLDHASGGRVGWNVVTTYDNRAAGNFGDRNLPTPEERYARAGEFVAVVEALWDSWEDDALVADVATGVYADPARVHRIDHRGTHFEVSGPLQLPRSPQGRPMVIQAGGSDLGRDLAARSADAVFSVQHVLSEARDYYADVKARAAALGRDADRLAILPGLFVIVGATEAEARARQRELDDIVGDRTTLERFARRLGIPVESLHPDRPVPVEYLARIGGAQGSRGFADATLALARDRSLTVRDIIARGGAAHRLVVGGPEQIADTMAEWFEGGAADGFNIMCDVFPGGLSAFVDHVVPVLQRRGLFRREYEGQTLRAHYGLPRPRAASAAERRTLSAAE